MTRGKPSNPVTPRPPVAPRKRELHLDLLASMAEDWNKRSQDLIRIAVAMALRAKGHDSVVINLSDIPAFLGENDVVAVWNLDTEGRPNNKLHISVVAKGGITFEELAAFNPGYPVMSI